ncbi:GDSL-type esterase/lipase family protein [Kribbella catacumbae]|uniref:GDSL-type esterase/lipase family protein n=1 Tax=Kribbella catacumbae TaxID=460086 RepID=UPI000365A69C|nr:GDSL-type esterase/lipase family protein [Kribbella catacumbae]
MTTQAASAWTGFRHQSTDSEGWTTFWRLDPRGENLDLVRWHGEGDRANRPPTAALWSRACTPAGVRGCWRTAARQLRLEIRGECVPEAAIGSIDVLVDGELHWRGRVDEGEQLVRLDLPGVASEIEVWLPHLGKVSIRGLAFDAPAAPVRRPGVRWTTYGSSITQSGAAAGPSETWPALVARANSWDAFALGLGGECHLDPVAARAIRDTPADLISLCIGINIFTGGSFSGRTLPGQVEAFLTSVRERQHRTPIVAITPLLAPKREGRANGVGLTLEDVRSCVSLGVQALIDRGDHALHLIDGRTILSETEALALYGDDVHPNAEGYRLIGSRLAPRLAAILPSASTGQSA